MVALTKMPETRTGRLQVIVPQVLRPKEQTLAGLSEADRQLLHKLLGEPYEYVDCDEFHEVSAEEGLFGSRTVLGAGSTYFIETQLADGGQQRPPGPTLTPTEEQLLFRQFNYARLRVVTILSKHCGRYLSSLALRELLGWAHRALMIRGQITQANIALVMTMAKKSHFTALDYNEIISAGNIALLRSVDRFDFSRGFKFSTYACQGILQRILHVVEQTKRYRSLFLNEYEGSFERDDQAEAKHDYRHWECVDDLRDLLSRNRASLTEVEQTVIRRRFAVGGDGPSEPMTLKEIGELIGITKERVRQIQKRALKKLRWIMEREYLAA